MVGVFNLEIARIYNYLLQQSGKKYTVVHCLEGYDEISLTGKFKTFSNSGETLVSPESIGFNIQKACSTVVTQNFETRIKDKHAEFIKMSMPKTLRSIFC